MFKDLCSRYQIKHEFTNPYNPTGNSISERINQCIGNVLRIMKGHPLDLIIERIENNLNLTHHRVLKCSPEQLVHNHSSIDPLRRPASLDLLTVKENIEAAARLSERTRNRNRSEHSSICMGDEVYRKTSYDPINWIVIG